MAYSVFDGPSVQNVRVTGSSNYQPINALLDELDIKDIKERCEFPAFLKEYMSWDDDQQTGYTREEYAQLSPATIECHAMKFLDEASIGPGDLSAGETFFPRRDLEQNRLRSLHPKKWTYSDHRDGIIEVVTQIMLTQSQNIARRLQLNSNGQEKLHNDPAGRTRKAREARARKRRRQRVSKSGTRSVSREDSDDEIGHARPMMKCISASRQNLPPASARTTIESTHTPTIARHTSSPVLERSVQHMDADKAEIDNFTAPNERAGTVIPMEDVAGFRAGNGHMNKIRLQHQIEGAEYASLFCMKAHTKLLISARNAPEEEQPLLSNKAEVIMDLLVELDNTLKNDKARLSLFVADTKGDVGK